MLIASGTAKIKQLFVACTNCEARRPISHDPSFQTVEMSYNLFIFIY